MYERTIILLFLALDSLWQVYTLKDLNIKLEFNESGNEVFTQ